MKKIRVLISIFTFVIVCFLCTEVSAFPPSTSTIYDGIDVSEWQGEINWVDVSNSGIDIAYIRASEGSGYEDPDAMRNYNGAKAVGIKVGFYHYLTATTVSEAIEQANFFVSVIQNLNVDCRLAMDFESFQGLGNYEINQISQAFLAEVERVSGKSYNI